MKASQFKLPSAWLPIAMSSVALIVVALRVLLSGVARDADEGAAAHLWQMLMVGQVPVIGWFLVRWVLKNPRQWTVVLAVQVGAVLVAAAPVYLLRL
ncbi:MAG TPA: hypothetical protein VGI90_06125 [Steroidobacteraceae bacterium]